MSEIITIAEVIHPAFGKKQGSVVDTQGRRWQVWADKLGLYAAGQSYEVVNFKSSVFQGKTYTTITEAIPVAPQGGVAQAPRPLRPHPIPAPQPAMASVSQTSDTDNARRMDIFVCGAFNNIMSNPSVSVLAMGTSDMISIVQQLKDTWRATLGPASPQDKNPQKRDDLDDEIPFR